MGVRLGEGGGLVAMNQFMVKLRYLRENGAFEKSISEYEMSV